MASNQENLTLCPFTKQPFDECAVKVITGVSIPLISRYCMGDYTLCPVYKSQQKSTKTQNKTKEEILPCAV